MTSRSKESPAKPRARYKMMHGAFMYGLAGLSQMYSLIRFSSISTLPEELGVISPFLSM